MLNGPIIDGAGTKRYYLDGQLHRIDGPAVEYVDGYKEWRLNGFFHREDGPAVEYHDGHKVWFIHGKELECKTQEEFKRLMRLKSFW